MPQPPRGKHPCAAYEAPPLDFLLHGFSPVVLSLPKFSIRQPPGRQHYQLAEGADGVRFVRLTNYASFEASAQRLLRSLPNVPFQSPMRALMLLHAACRARSSLCGDFATRPSSNSRPLGP